MANAMLSETVETMTHFGETGGIVGFVFTSYAFGFPVYKSIVFLYVAMQQYDRRSFGLFVEITFVKILPFQYHTIGSQVTTIERYGNRFDN